MKLRLKLILAFLLLSVLPLAGMTIYGYQSSISAFRVAVEAEADDMTAEMSGRMETVTADLSSRMQRLNGLPYEALLAQNTSGAGDAGAENFIRRLKTEIGDAAPLIQRLKYTPAPRRPPTTPRATPSGAAPQVMPRMIHRTESVIDIDSGSETPETDDGEPFVIHLNSMIFDNDDDGVGWEDGDELPGAARGPRVIQSGKNWIVLPRELQGLTSTVVPDILDSIRVFVDDEEAELIIEKISATMRDAEFDREDKQLAEAREMEESQARREVEIQKETLAAFQEVAAQASGRLKTMAEHFNSDPEQFQRRMSEEGFGVAMKELAKQTQAEGDAPQFKMARKFECNVEQDGKTVGHVEAQLNASEVLRTVLSETRSDQGEIPFAITADGSVLTPDEDDQKELEELGLGKLANNDGAIRPTQLGDNWVVQTRQVPEMDLVFGIARPVGDSLGAIRRTAGRNMGLGLGIVFVSMLGIFPLSGRMTHNLSRLTRGAERLAHGDLDVRVPVRSNDEFGALARTFNRMGADLQENQRQLVHQERLKKELEMCRQIQDEMLPRGRSNFPFAEVRAVSIPAREVGGDFFNYFTLPNGDVAILMGDVSGKGVPAAMMMANLQAMLKARLPLEPDLARLATALDEEIEAGTPREAYVTLFMAVIDAKRQVLRYVNAGHNTQYLMNGEEGTTSFVSSGRPLGLFSGGRYVQHECPLKAGDLLFLFTDGLTEAEDERGSEFGVTRLRELLEREQHGEPETILQRVEAEIHAYRGKAEPSDDATMLALRYAPVSVDTAS